MPHPEFGRDLGLSPALSQAAATLGFSTPTAIQVQAIPPALAGRDLLASAQTGSGKTAAFALPLLQRLRPAASGRRRTQALVLVPTRELATQVGDVLRRLSMPLPQPPRLAVLFGGVSINPQLMALRGGADLVVATPGRLLDVVAHNGLRLNDVDLLVLDEADRLLDAGFADELARVLALLGERPRQTLLFSATFPPALEALAQRLLHDPVRVAVDAVAAHEPQIVQRAIAVDSTRRTQLLRQLIKDHGWQRVLVFVATRHSADIVAEKLYRAGVFASPFHGELSQGARQQVLDEFRDERWEVVVTTDLAARGIDLPDLPVVVNYDLPRSAVDHVHRIGRTGRAGASGLAVSFVTPASEAHFQLIEKRQRMSLPREVVAGFEPTEPAPAPAPGSGGIKGRRPSKKDKLRAAAAKAAGQAPG